MSQHDGDLPVVDLAHFLEATRDSGYRSFAAAVSELIDNSLQAGARSIDVIVGPDQPEPSALTVAVLDDGSGMNREQLARALQFGGSSRFNDREGLGRFGMGLPNASLSRARRVDVYSWRNKRWVWHAVLDLDELLLQDQTRLPTPARCRLADEFRGRAGASGTLVVWSRLDRLSAPAAGVSVRQLSERIGRVFRYPLWGGVRIAVNGAEVMPVDPLFLSDRTSRPYIRAAAYGEVLKYDVRVPGARERETAQVEVRFSELPVAQLADLPSQEKRRCGLIGGAGVSVVRAGREIDAGWLLFGKQRENYDDWWRCEIRFPPVLDEMFGVTHTKQGITPSLELRGILGEELTTTARTLNRRARAAHMEHGAVRAQTAAVRVATERDRRLKPIEASRGGPTSDQPNSAAAGHAYQITAGEIAGTAFMTAEHHGQALNITLNSTHDFYHCFYRRLGSREMDDAKVRRYLELTLLALGRTLALDRPADERRAVDGFLRDWSRALAVFCRS